MKLHKVLVGLVAVAAITAQAELKPYLYLGADLTMMPDSEMSYKGITGMELSYDPGFAVQGAVGIATVPAYDEPVLRAELAFSYQQNEIDEIEDTLGVLEGTPGATYSANEDITIATVMMNAYLDIPTGSIMVPYLMAGLGGADIDIDGADDLVMAGQAGIGLGFELTDAMTLDVSYRYFITEKAKLAEPAETDLSAHKIGMGIRYRF